MDDNLVLSCIEAVVNGFMSGGQLGQEYVPALEFCRNELLSNQEKEACYYKLVKRMGLVYEPEKISYICSAFEEDYKNLCLE